MADPTQQPTATKELSSAMVEIDTAHAASTVPADMALIEQNYDSNYLNPDLESLLNTRGFSTQRAEILGLFNYVAPLELGTDSGDGEEYLITPSGELYDYQCQLKQLRYSDALGFFTKMLGFELRDTSAGHELTPGYATAYASSSDQSDLLENYSTEMTTAKSVLDYLTAIYNAVSNFIDAQDIARNYTIFGDTADVVSSTRTLKTGADNTNYNKLLLALPMPDNGSGITENLVSLLTTDAVNPKVLHG